MGLFDFFRNKKLELSDFVEMNQKGIQLEKDGKVDKAVELYEKVIAHDFIGSHPYNRLAIIYRKRKDYDNEIRVLEKAIYVYENKNSTGNKLEGFKDRLSRAKELKNKNT